MNMEGVSEVETLPHQKNVWNLWIHVMIWVRFRGSNSEILSVEDKDQCPLAGHVVSLSKFGSLIIGSKWGEWRNRVQIRPAVPQIARSSNVKCIQMLYDAIPVR